MKINTKNLTFTYFNGKMPRSAVENFSCEISSGQFVALVGPSGCGKYTLLRLMANLLQPTSGSILLDGKAPARVVELRQIAWMSQSPALLTWLTVGQNVALAQRFQPQGASPQLTAQEALQKVGLSDALNIYPSMLSGGMQQRLALARVLTMDARLWLMDEPFAALDELTRERLTIEMLDLWRPFKPTVLWVTHNIYEAVRLADRILVMSPAPGKLTADLQVDLPRPRMDSSTAFQSLIQQLRNALGQPLPESRLG